MAITIHVPTSVAAMKPPRPADLITEASNFLRAHWDDVLPFFQAISGEVPSIHGSSNLDEAACIFKVQAMAVDNGYAQLGSVQAAKLRRAVRYAYKRNTGIAVYKLEQQRIEQRRELAAAAA